MSEAADLSVSRNSNNGPAVRGSQSRASRLDKATDRGKLKIGDDWNAIRIIALSQSNPLKAIAEFVENSIDAHAKTVTITRGREHGEHYLSIKDDGDGVPRDDEGKPNFKYVATHICDSIKRRLKAEGVGNGLQGEFGIGLLSFWTIGDQLTMISAGSDQRSYQMMMRKGDPGYAVSPRRVLFAEGGTELRISPLLEGIRILSGEKIQWYLASELRDRIRSAEVRVTVIDKLARKQYEVEPRAFEGRLLHQLPAIRTPVGDAYAELYLAEPADSCRVSLTRAGTRVIEDLATLPGLERAPWSSKYLQGLIDVPFLNLTPGTRSGIIHDERYAALLEALQSLEIHLNGLIEAQRRAEEEQASQQSLRAIQRAFREALLALPPEEYDWFDIQARARHESGPLRPNVGELGPATGEDGPADFGVAEPSLDKGVQKQFFDYAGPLFSVLISPASSTITVNERRHFRALPRDRSRRRVEEDLRFSWEIAEGGGSVERPVDQEVEYLAPSTPGLARLTVLVSQHDITCTAEALVTITASLESSMNEAVVNTRGLPGYTFERAAGELWRSRFDLERNLIIVNSGHRDFVFATKNRALQLRYLVRLYVKELVLRNFAGISQEQLLERMIELSLYAEEKLKSS
ncbi:MAG TPA: ATP-binding protein [Bryobacteraceae bacterium]|nr:ATP-binding protein [Bryobacteraceae bacterium]